MDRRCPNDQAQLVEINKNGVMVDVCPECKGMWLDRGELEKIMTITRELEAEFGAVTPPRRPEPAREDDARREYERSREYARPRDDDDDDRRYRDPRYTKDSGEWDDDRKRKKSRLGRLLDIFD